MERITARWPDGRSVRFWDREVSGDAAILSELDRRSRITGEPDFRKSGIAFMTASSAVRAPEVPEFESRGVSVPI